MSRFESNALSPDDPFEREQLLVAAELLRAAQTDIYTELHDHVRSLPVDADTVRQAFPAQYEQLTSAVERLTGRVVAGDYKLLGYYQGEGEGEKTAALFDSQLGSWRDEKRFIGILRGLADITHGLPVIGSLHRPATVVQRDLPPRREAKIQRLVFVIDPIEQLPESKERNFYMRNYISGRLENPFNDTQNPGSRAFVPVDAVPRLDIDRSYILALQDRARFLGAVTDDWPPKNDTK